MSDRKYRIKEYGGVFFIEYEGSYQDYGFWYPIIKSKTVTYWTVLGSAFNTIQDAKDRIAMLKKEPIYHY